MPIRLRAFEGPFESFGLCLLFNNGTPSCSLRRTAHARGVSLPGAGADKLGCGGL